MEHYIGKSINYLLFSKCLQPVDKKLPNYLFDANSSLDVTSKALRLPEQVGTRDTKGGWTGSLSQCHLHLGLGHTDQTQVAVSREPLTDKMAAEGGCSLCS